MPRTPKEFVDCFDQDEASFIYYVADDGHMVFLKDVKELFENPFTDEFSDAALISYDFAQIVLFACTLLHIDYDFHIGVMRTHAILEAEYEGALNDAENA